MYKSRMSVAEAAHLLGVSPQCVRIGMQRGAFKFGAVVQMKEKVYVIFRDKFEQETGIKTKGENQ